ncbi:MAG TPA: ribonuclease III [Planctomycetaceae bacterium]|nr:ribonuclease III [Planctomycetaceae bacterium]
MSQESFNIEDHLTACEDVIGYRFRDRLLLQRCLTHASIARTRLDSNERLEFLGDAILGTIVCELLFHRLPEEPEGELTRIKSVVVSRSACARISQAWGLSRFLILGKGLSLADSVPSSVLAAVFESLVAGVYLDGGLEATKRLVEPWVTGEIEHALQSTHGKNYKSLLQQFAQKSLGATPVYQLLDEKGPDHSKCFKVAAAVGPETFLAAWGPNKKEAEQRAAENAWHQLQGEPAPNDAEAI